jgi:hypothetical protein
MTREKADASQSFACFMARPAGRALRIAAGAVMVAAGWGAVGDTGGTVLAVAGLLPIAAGVFNFCGIAPLIGAPFWGRDAHAR